MSSATVSELFSQGHTGRHSGSLSTCFEPKKAQRVNSIRNEPFDVHDHHLELVIQLKLITSTKVLTSYSFKHHLKLNRAKQRGALPSKKSCVMLNCWEGEMALRKVVKGGRKTVKRASLVLSQKIFLFSKSPQGNRLTLLEKLHRKKLKDYSSSGNHRSV